MFATEGKIHSDLEFGQTRSVSEDVVQQRYRELLDNPPANLLRLVVFLDTGVLCHFLELGDAEAKEKCEIHDFVAFFLASNNYLVLSGQHVFSAAMRVNQDKTKNNLTVPRYVWNGGVEVGPINL